MNAFESYKNNDYDKSIKYFDQLIKMDSLTGGYYYYKASAYGRLGKMKEAKAAFLNRRN